MKSAYGEGGVIGFTDPRGDYCYVGNKLSRLSYMKVNRKFSKFHGGSHTFHSDPRMHSMTNYLYLLLMAVICMLLVLHYGSEIHGSTSTTS